MFFRSNMTEVISRGPREVKQSLIRRCRWTQRLNREDAKAQNFVLKIKIF